MSTLTKILIVLLTLSSIFLCGIVVTYVANAEDYRKQNTALKRLLSAARESAKIADGERQKIRDESERLQTRLNSQIAALQTQISKTKNDFINAEREKAKLIQDLANMTSVSKTFAQTAGQQTELFNNARVQLKDVTAKRNKLEIDLEQTIATLNEKLAVIAMLEADVRRLEEARAQVQGKLDKFYREFGKESVPPTPVTPRPGKVKPAPPIVRKMDLKGLVTTMDLKNSVAEISIGTAEGVKKGMKFYVTRGEEFICEIWIHYVDTEKAVGDLKLVQKQPRAGDTVTTNL
ncbi:MAG: hypothetical protein ACYSTG_10015 [Planctomycetota bacterium]